MSKKVILMPTNPLPSSEHRKHDYNIERFRNRLISKLLVIFVSVTQIIMRLVVTFTENGITSKTSLFFLITLPLLASHALVVLLEYFFYKKIGPKVMDYSRHFDITLLFLFALEWVASTISSLGAVDTDPPTLKMSSIFGFTSCAWRTLYLLLLNQSWKLLILPPTAAVGVAVGYAVYYVPDNTVQTILRGTPQMIYLIILMYLLDRMKWKEVFTNVQQERWMRINDFILNNIPENIVILELGGCQVRFVSDYCRVFMQKVQLSSDPKELFRRIKDLYRQPDETEHLSSSPFSDTSAVQLEKIATIKAFLEPRRSSLLSLPRVNSLQDLIENFKILAQETNLQERQFLIYNGKLKTEDNQTKSIEIKVSYIEQHNTEYMVLNIRDTTQRDLLVTLEDNNKYKDQLLASVSHELRAPLNGNINLVESAIGNKSIPQDAKEKLLIPALRSSKFLLHLINDILDMSQIKAQKLRLIFKSEKLQETLKDTLQLIEVQAKRKGIELTLAIHPEVQGNLCTDHVRLSQIVLNLLNNAIKFTQKGSIILSATPTEDPNCVKISVRDSGIGIKAEDTNKLFSDYTHIEIANRAAINPTGIGLGLSISSNLAKLLGPKDQQGILVESVVNKGSTFAFLVENKGEQLSPMEKSLERSCDVLQEFQVVTKPPIFPKLFTSFSTTVSIHTDDKFALKKSKCVCPKVLIVDDNPFNTMAFETILGSLDVKCESVFSGRSAIEKILGRERHGCGDNCKPYQVIFMDQEMPEMTGSETVKEIRRLQSENSVSEVKIIGCTAHGSKVEVEKFMKAGLEMCIHKPITPLEIHNILRGYEIMP